MEFNFFKLLILLQLMFIPKMAGYRPEGARIVLLQKVKVVKENLFLSADNSKRYIRPRRTSFAMATNIQVKKDITPEDGLTVSCNITTDTVPTIPEADAQNITFCMDDTSSDMNGSIVKIFRMAFSLQPERCPIKKGPRPDSTPEMVIYGLEVPQHRKFTNIKYYIRLEAPGLGEIAAIEALY